MSKLMFNRITLLAITGLLTAAGVSFTPSSSAHNIDVNQAKLKVEAYAQKVARDRSFPYSWWTASRSIAGTTIKCGVMPNIRTRTPGPPVVIPVVKKLPSTSSRTAATGEIGSTT